MIKRLTILVNSGCIVVNADTVAFVEQLVDTAPLVQPGVKIFLRILACVVLADSSVNVLRLDTWDVVSREDSA